MSDEQTAQINLTPETEQALKRVINRHTTGQQLAKRARMIEMAAGGKSDSAIARSVGVNRHTVRLWRIGWLMLEAFPLSELSVAERLEDLPRPGVPARITADERCQWEALACTAPEKSGRPISQWTGREIAAEVIQQKSVETISPRHAARLLKRSRHSSTP
jgi:transposase